MGLAWDGYQPHFFILSIIFPILATIAVALRFHSRRLARQDLAADDWLILAALIFCYGWCVNIVIDSQIGGLGGHVKFTPTGIPLILGRQAEVLRQTNYVSVILAVPTLGLIKLSIAFLYKRIFATHAFVRVAWVVIVILIAWTISGTLTSIFPCWPVSDGWAVIPKGKCVNIKAMYTAGVATNTAVDVIVIVVPLYKVWHLQMPLRRKIGVCLIFALGGFVMITGIIRMVYLVQSYDVISEPLWVDYTYEVAPAILWTVVELNLGVICACLPLMRPVWNNFGLGTRLGSVFSKISMMSRESQSKMSLPSFIKQSNNYSESSKRSHNGSDSALRGNSSERKDYEVINMYSIEERAHVPASHI